MNRTVHGRIMCVVCAIPMAAVTCTLDSVTQKISVEVKVKTLIS